MNRPPRPRLSPRYSARARARRLASFAASAGTLERFVRCESHGSHRWKGEMVCAACGWLFQLVRAESGLYDGPDYCRNCSTSLESSARICCGECFARCGGAGHLASLSAEA